MKHSYLFIIVAASISVQAAVAQRNITIEQCRSAAVESSALSEQQKLSTQRWGMKSRAASAALTPQLEINSQASYQSSTVQFPDALEQAIPGVGQLSRDQYRASLDLNQVIYAGGKIRNTRKVYDVSNEVDNLSLEVEIDRLRDNINSLYMGILLTRGNLSVVETMLSSAQADLRAVEAGVQYGVRTGSDLAAITAQIATLVQQQAEQNGNLKSLIGSLSILTQMQLSAADNFAMPEQGEIQSSNQRTEISLFGKQRSLLDVQNRLLNSNANPSVSFYASGGYGRPGYNIISNQFAPMGIAGIRLKVPLTAWDATQKEKRANSLQQLIIDQKLSDFKRTNSVQIAQALADMEKFREMSLQDSEIVAARQAVRERSVVKLKEGVITASEYVTTLNEETRARINQTINQIRIAQSYVQYQALLGIY